MTKSPKTRAKFIELRASGVTLANAAKQLDISYNTAVNWQKNLQDKIDSAKTIKMDELMEKYLMTKQRRLELFGERLLAIKDELDKRDLSEVPTPKLFAMMDQCINALDTEAKDIPAFRKEKEENSVKTEVGWGRPILDEPWISEEVKR